MADKGKGGIARLFTFVIGGIVGAVGGLLLAPRPGKENREWLKERAEELMEEGFDKYGDQIDRVRDMASERGMEMMGRIEEARERLVTGVESASEAMRERINIGAEEAGQEVVTAEPKAEKPAEKPAKKPAAKSAKKAAEKPAEKVAEEPVETLLEEPAEMSVEEPAEKPEETK